MKNVEQRPSIEPAGTALFGLRTNAHQLIAGTGVAAVRRRIGLAGLFHDRVVLELGIYDLSAGPTGNMPRYHPGPLAGETVRWQSPRERGTTEPFHVRLRPTGAPDDAPFHEVMRSETRLRWRATFLPFFDEVRHAAPWLVGAWIDDPPGTSSMVNRMARRDENDPMLTKRWPDAMVRSAVARGASQDFKRAVETGSTLYSDPFHARLLEAHVRRGEAVAVLGQHALDVIVPRDLTWAEITELRSAKGLVEYRTILRSIEGEARENATSLADIDARIMRLYADALARASARVPWVRTRAIVLGVGFVVGEAVGLAAGVPFVGGLAGGLAGEAAATTADRLVRPRWLAADARVQGRR